MVTLTYEFSGVFNTQNEVNVFDISDSMKEQIIDEPSL